MRAERNIADGRLAWGFDRAVGFFVDVRRPGQKTFVYDRLESTYDHDRPLLGATRFLVTAGVIAEDDLDGVLLDAVDGVPAVDEGSALTAGEKLGREILDRFRAAADQG